MATIGFIGVGVMGREMVINLAKAGHQVLANDVRMDVVKELAAHGVKAADTVAAASAEADIVITMLPDVPHVEAVVNELVKTPPKGKVVVDMSTIGPIAAKRFGKALAGVGVDFIDAPVSGGVTGARDAKLTIMAGGKKDAYERALPVLKAMSHAVRLVGDSGAGQAVKLCNQIVCALHLQAVCEAFALGRAAGMDPAIVREVLMGGSANSWIMENLGPIMIDKDDSATFRIDLMLKDLRLANEAAFTDGVPLPATALVTSLYLEARAHGEGDKGNQALFRVYDRITNQPN